MKDIVLSSLWTISSIFMFSAILYLYFIKRKHNHYSNKVYSIMLISVIVSTILEFLSVYTISIRNTIPILNEIVCRTYVYSVILWSFTTFEHMAYYDKRINVKKLRIMEIIFAIICLVLCIILPIEYTNGIPYAIKGSLAKLLLIYIAVGSVIETILLSFDVIKLKDSSIFPYVLIATMLVIISAYQILTGNYMNVISPFITFVVVYQFYNTESQDLALLEEYKIIKAKSDEKNKERDEFISNLSRNIRTPMSSIVGYSNLIKLDNDMDIEKIKIDGKEINKEALSLLRTINNILDLSRFDAGKEVLDEKDYSFEKLLVDINDRLTSTYKDIKINYKIMNDFPSDLCGDVNKLEKIILLICEYINKGRIDKILDLEISYKYINNQYIQIKIVFKLKNETIEEELRQDKFEFDMQIIDAYNKVLRSYFNVDLDVDNNKICTFIINQLVNGPRKIENIYEKLSNKKELVIKEYKDKTILIVDDSQMNINISKRLFNKYSFIIEEATSGNDAIKMIQNKKYDIVFLDDMMPGLSGVDTLSKLKEMNISLPPIVALTANSYDGLKEEYESKGFDYYLSKPIDPINLNKIINDLLEGGNNND